MYSDHFKLADDLIDHLDSVLVGMHDPFIASRYAGFVAVCSVTVLEMALKAILCDFAEAKHKVLGTFCAKHFERINGRIGLDTIVGEYLPRFGTKYQSKFQRALEKLEIEQLRTTGGSVKQSYRNLLTWRNGFSHGGNVPQNATYHEVKLAYVRGKTVMDCLASCMRR
jgi:hypothetical protein